MQRTPFKTTLLSLALISLAGVASAQWVAYNDHVAGTNGQTAANATTNDMRQASTNTLKNFATGATIPNVLMTVSVAGGTPATGGTGGNPNSGTPLYNVFNTNCYFGANVIQVTAAETITVTFSGLDPNKRYKFQAGSCRGSTYTDRWTKCDLLGVDAATTNHQQGSASPYGIITAANEPTLMTGYQVAYNSGINLAGDMLEWDNINPGADGTFQVTSTQWQYTNAVPSHGVTNGTFTPGSTSYGYALDAFRLEEVASAGPVTIPSSGQPTNQTVLLGDPFSLNVLPSGATPYYYQWFKGSIPGTALQNQTNQTYSVAISALSDDANYYVIVSNATSRATSSVVHITISTGTPLTITSQPASQNVALGQGVSFTVGVSGSKPQYQWFKDGSAIPTATNSSYNISAIASNDLGGYTVRITNIYSSSVTSIVATLTLNTNKQALFLARTNLSGADIVISNRLSALGFVVIVQDDRTCQATNALGKSLIAISSSVDPTQIAGKFTLAVPPLITWEPGCYSALYLVANSGVVQGTNAAQQGIAIWDPTSPLAGGLSNTQLVFSAPQTISYGIPTGNAVVAGVSTNGTNQAVIFGYEKGALLAQFNWPAPARRVGFFLGDNGATNLTAAGSNLFTAAVTWAMGTPIASTTPIGISKQPVNISVQEGTMASFALNVTGAPPYYLQWRCNGTNLPNATSRILDYGPTGPADNGLQFSLYATNKVPTAVTSVVVTLTVVAPTPISITSQPTNQSYLAGGTATFSVSVTGTAPRYQWYKGPVGSGVAILNATNATYVITNVTDSDGGTYYATITNRVSSPSTVGAVLTILPPIAIAITTQPQNIATNLGQGVTFTVAYTGTSVLLQWYKDGSLIAGATNTSYVINSTALTDVGNYYVVLTNRTSGAVTSQTAILFILPPVQPILTMSNIWRYNTNAVDLSTTNWTSLAYNDSSWQQGTNAFFYPTNEALLGGMTIKTALPLVAQNSTNLITTIYFRTHINFTNDPVGVSIVFSNMVDDGAVYYLNGQEVHRFNMPNTAVNYDTYASASREANAGWDVFTNSPYLFLPGDNVLAVEVHQCNNTSSDIGFGNMVSLVFLPPTILSITNQPQNLTVEEAKTATFTVGVAGDGARLQWYKDGVLIPGATKDFLTLTNLATTDSGGYSVTLSNAFSFLTSRTATLTVLVDTNPPTLLVADGSLAQTNILLTFSESVLSTSVTPTNFYLLTNVTGGGNAIKITKVVVQNTTNILLTTATARTNGANYVLIVSGAQDVSPHHNLLLTNSLIPVTTQTNMIDWLSPWHFWDPIWMPPDSPFCSIEPWLCDTSHIDLGTAWLAANYEPPWPTNSDGSLVFSDNTGNLGAFYTLDTDLPIPPGWHLTESSGYIVYFRTHFTNNSSPIGLGLKLQYLVNDGAIFYVNGVEIYRVNMPAGPATYQTPAVSNMANVALSDVIDVPASALHQGDNVMEVEVHGAAALDTDLAFAMRLTARRQSIVGTPILLTSSPASQTVPEGQPASFSFTAVGAISSQWYQSGVAIPGATNPIYTIPAVTMAMDDSTYYVVANNSSLSVTSAPANLTVIADTNPPTLAGAYATATTNILVSFSEPMDPQSATNLLNYTLKNSAGSPLTIYRAVLINGTNVLLTVGAMNDSYNLTVNNVRDASSNKNYIAPNTMVSVGMQVTIPINATWKYNNLGNDLGTGWITNGFIDTSWPASNAIFWVKTDVPQPQNTQIYLTNAAGTVLPTVYFRLHFTAPMAVSNALINITHVIDDGAVFYLNGSEFYRFNMPGGQMNYTNFSSTTIGTAAYMGPFTTNVNLQTGDNVIAVEVHQANLSSSDITFGAQMSINIPSNPVQCTCPSDQPQLYFEKQAGNNLHIYWLGAGFWLDRATNLAKIPANTIWAPVLNGTSQNNNYYEPMTNAPAHPLFYRLRCTCP